MGLSLTGEEKGTLLRTARQAIKAGLSQPPGTAAGGQNDEAGAVPTQGALAGSCGAFVTLHKAGSLRGCIGYISGHGTLLETVKEAAVACAFQDTRFSPLQADELDDVEIEISVLSPFRRISGVEAIEVGKHGIMIRQGFRSGLLLPQVALEYGWDRETLLANTCYKAGLAGDCWKSKETAIEIFSAVIFREGADFSV